MDKLWAPWRASYIHNKKQKGCIFCEAARAKRGRYVIFKTRYSQAMLNIYPYNNGHVMVSPLKHIKDLSKFSIEQKVDLFDSIVRAKMILDRALKPHGYNLGINISGQAGAGIPGHLHVHIVPRWKGDTNFMPVVACTKVISQSLDELYRKLKGLKL